MAGGEEHGRPEDRMGNGEFTFQGFPYWSLGHLSRGSDATQRLLQYLRGGFSASRWLSAQRRSGIDAILAYEPTSPMLLSLSRFARANRIPLILDLAEWHDGSHLPGGRFGLRSADGALRMRYLYARTSYVIAISSYLANFYRTKGCSVIRVPPLVDLTEPKWQTTPSQSPGLLRLVYAGTPGMLGRIVGKSRSGGNRHVRSMEWYEFWPEGRVRPEFRQPCQDRSFNNERPALCDLWRHESAGHGFRSELRQ